MQDREARQARAQMEEAKRASEKQFSDPQHLPKRYQLYDKIKDNVSLRTIDIVIVVVSVLIVVALIAGIVTATPQR